MRHFDSLKSIKGEGGELITVDMKKVERAVKLHSERLLKVAYTYTKNMDDAQDMVQEAFCRYMVKAPIFLSDEHEKAWLIRITVNLCKSHLTSSAVKGRSDLDENISTSDSYDSGLMSAVMELPEKYRLVIHLFYYEGYSVKEIAKLQGGSTSSVTTRLQRARELLKTKLGDDYL